MVYNVYIRSMTTYNGGSELKKLRYGTNLNKFFPIGFFNTLSDAEKYLFSVGKKLTIDFFENYEQGCSFVIIEQKNYDIEKDDLSDCEDLSLYLGKYINYNNYVFSEESYQMLLKEHLILIDNAWANPVPTHIFYVQDNGDIIRGCSEEHYEKATERYFQDSKILADKKWVEFKKSLGMV